MFQAVIPRFGDLVPTTCNDFQYTRKLLSTPNLVEPAKRKKSPPTTTLPLKKRKRKTSVSGMTFLTAKASGPTETEKSNNTATTCTPPIATSVTQPRLRKNRVQPTERRFRPYRQSLPGNPVSSLPIVRPPPQALVDTPSYGWQTVDGVEIPYVLRGDQKFVSVSMFDDHLLLRFPARYPTYLLGKTPVVCHPGLFHEITLLNRLQESSSRGPHGPLIVGDLLAPLEGILDFYLAVKSAYESIRPIDLSLDRVVSGSWIQLNDTVIPCIKRLLVAEQKCRMLPLSMITQAARSSSDLSQFSMRATPEECDVLSRMCILAGLCCHFDVGTQLITLKDLVCHINWLSNIILMLNSNTPLDGDHSTTQQKTLTDKERRTSSTSTTAETQNDSGISPSTSSLDTPPLLSRIPVPVVEQTVQPANTDTCSLPHPVVIPIPVLESTKKLMSKAEASSLSRNSVVTKVPKKTEQTVASTGNTIDHEPMINSESKIENKSTPTACSHKAPREVADQGDRINQVCTCGLPTLGELISDINSPRTQHNRTISLSRPEIGKGFSRPVPAVRQITSGRKALLLRVRQVVKHRSKSPSDNLDTQRTSSEQPSSETQKDGTGDGGG